MSFDGSAFAVETAYRDDRFYLNFETGIVSVDGSPLPLTNKERELLEFLVENKGEIVPREVLLDRVWGYSTEIRTRTLDVHIRRLRKKMGSYGDSCIETVFRIGYRFQGKNSRAVPLNASWLTAGSGCGVSKAEPAGDRL